MVFVLVIIFVFLFICFIWGIGSVVGSIKHAAQPERNAISRNDVSPKRHEIPPSVTHGADESSIATAQALNLDVTSSEDSTSASATLGAVLNHLQVISDLHKQGTLNNEEFAMIKTKLIKDIQRI